MSHPIPGYEYHCEFCFELLEEGLHECKNQ